jgi:hypothetical protein
MTPRVDIASTIHKAIRRILFTQSMDLARTDFREASECRKTTDGVLRALELLHEHAEHEDTVVFPAVAAEDRSVAAAAARDHAALEEAMREIGRLAVTLSAVTPAERPEIGQKLTVLWNRFVGDQLRHLAFEESEVSAVLLRAHTDEELIAMRARIQATVPPDRAPIWMDLLLSSVDPVERAAMEAAMPGA